MESVFSPFLAAYGRIIARSIKFADVEVAIGWNDRTYTRDILREEWWLTPHETGNGAVSGSVSET